MTKFQSGRQLHDFIKESNAIEGIYDPPTGAQFTCARCFLTLPKVQIQDIIIMVNTFQDGAALRRYPNMGVMVGNYIGPPGGPEILRLLELILESINNNTAPPFHNHYRYERLHPFTDCNGRSGRLLWLWQMMKFNYPFYNSFLQTWYYQSLA